MHSFSNWAMLASRSFAVLLIWSLAILVCFSSFSISCLVTRILASREASISTMFLRASFIPASSSDLKLEDSSVLCNSKSLSASSLVLNLSSSAESFCWASVIFCFHLWLIAVSSLSALYFASRLYSSIFSLLSSARVWVSSA